MPADVLKLEKCVVLEISLEPLSNGPRFGRSQAATIVTKPATKTRDCKKPKLLVDDIRPNSPLRHRALRLWVNSSPAIGPQEYLDVDRFSENPFSRVAILVGIVKFLQLVLFTANQGVPN